MSRFESKDFADSIWRIGAGVSFGTIFGKHSAINTQLYSRQECAAHLHPSVLVQLPYRALLPSDVDAD